MRRFAELMAVILAINSARRRNRLRLKWLLEQCEAVGYKPWTVPKLISELDDRLKNEKIAGQEKPG